MIEPRLDRNRALGAGLQLVSRARRQYRPAAPGRGAQTRAQRRQARSARSGPNITPGYWRAPNSPRRPSTRKAITRSATRLKFADPERASQRLAVRRAASPRISSSRPAPGSASGRCARPSSRILLRWCATSCSPAPTATSSRALVFPDFDACRNAAPGRRRGYSGEIVACRSPCDSRVQPSARCVFRCGKRHVEPRHPRHPDARTAVARSRRNDRQRLDQPARGAGQSRGNWSKNFTPTRRRATSWSPAPDKPSR